MSRADAKALLTSVDNAEDILVKVNRRAKAALKSSHIESFGELIKSKPLSSDDIDLSDFSVFEPATVDLGFHLVRVVEGLWMKLETHKTQTDHDERALSAATQLGEEADQLRYGVVLNQLDQKTIGATVAVISNPSIDEGGHTIFDVQERPGSKVYPSRAYSGGFLRSSIEDMVIPIEVEASREGGSLFNAERSHRRRYRERLEEIAQLSAQAIELREELSEQLRVTVTSEKVVRARTRKDRESAAKVLKSQLTKSQATLSELRSGVSGASRKALDASEPIVDQKLLLYISSLRADRPFKALDWSHLAYESLSFQHYFFEYARELQKLWALMDELDAKYQDNALISSIDAWPAEYRRVLKLHADDMSSGYAVAFRELGGKVIARMGTFKGARREVHGGREVYRAEWTPLLGGESEVLTEYETGFPALSEEPRRWWIRIDPHQVLGKIRSPAMPGPAMPGGPLVSAAQAPYRGYYTDLLRLMSSLRRAQGAGDTLLEELRFYRPHTDKGRHSWLDSKLREKAREERLEHEYRMPRSTSTDPFEPLPTELMLTLEFVRINGREVLGLRDGSVDPSNKRDGATGYFINRMYRALIERATFEKLLAKRRPNWRREKGVGSRYPPWRFEGKITIMPHVLSNYRLITETVYTAGQAGYRDLQFVGANARGERRALRTTAISFEDRGIETSRPDSSLNLMLIITDDGFRLAASGGSLPRLSEETIDDDRGPMIRLRQGSVESCVDPDAESRARLRLGPPPCLYDFAALRQYASRIKSQYPDETLIVIAGENRIQWQVVVSTIDAVRGTSQSPLFPEFLLSSRVF